MACTWWFSRLVNLHEDPLVTFLLNEHSPFFVKADTAGVEDRRRKDSVADGREALLIKVT